MYLFRVSDRFEISDRGLLLLPGSEANYVPVGTQITIVRPDNSQIETKIIGIAFDSSHSVTVEKSLTKEDVPIGSEVWANKSITYNLKHYNLKNKISDGNIYKIVFQHKIDPEFFMILKLSRVIDIMDHLTEEKVPLKLKIEPTNTSNTNELTLHNKTEELQSFEALIFVDEDCASIVFRGTADEIVYSGTRQHS